MDKLTGVFSVGTIAVPSFVVALYSLLIFAVGLNWLPAIGAGKAGDPVSQLQHLILPSMAVGLGWVGYLARLVRASMLEVLGENHIRTGLNTGTCPVNRRLHSLNSESISSGHDHKIR